jgi:hypothetical protein
MEQSVKLELARETEVVGRSPLQFHSIHHKSLTVVCILHLSKHVNSLSTHFSFRALSYSELTASQLASFYPCKADGIGITSLKNSISHIRGNSLFRNPILY